MLKIRMSCVRNFYGWNGRLKPPLPSSCKELLSMLQTMRILKKNGFTLLEVMIAMSILASGAIKPKEAVEYVCQQPNIRSIVFGASSRQHIEETKQLIENFS